MHQEKLLERAFVNNFVYLNFQSLSRGTMYQIFETLNNFYALLQAVVDTPTLKYSLSTAQISFLEPFQTSLISVPHYLKTREF